MYRIWNPFIPSDLRRAASAESAASAALALLMDLAPAAAIYPNIPEADAAAGFPWEPRRTDDT
jgi:hypothetical protein